MSVCVVKIAESKFVMTVCVVSTQVETAVWQAVCLPKSLTCQSVSLTNVIFVMLFHHTMDQNVTTRIFKKGFDSWAILCSILVRLIAL